MTRSRDTARAEQRTRYAGRFLYWLGVAAIVGLALGAALGFLISRSVSGKLVLLFTAPVFALIAAGCMHGLILVPRRRAVDDLAREQRNVLQSILDSLGDGVAVADREGRMVQLNPAAQRILGVGLTDTGPEEWSSTYGLFHTDMVTPFAADELPLGQAVRGKQTGEVDMFVRNPQIRDGVFIRINATPLLDCEGRPMGGVAVFRDVTERKKALDAVRESEARFRQLAESIPQVFWMSDVEVQRAVYVSPAYEKIWSRPIDSLYRDPLDWVNGVHPEDRAHVLENLERSKMRKYQMIFRIVRPDGEVRWIRDSGFPVFDEHNRFQRMSGIAEDITEERVALEDRRLRDLAAHLQNARENERISIARELHDELGQALTGLKLEVSYIIKRLDGRDGDATVRLDALAPQIDEIIRSVQRITTELRPVLLDEVGLFDAVQWQLREFEERTGVKCELQRPIEEPGWDGRRSTALYRIVQESLTNVARHAGASRVEVEFRRSDGHVILEVRDDGRGICEEEIKSPRSFGLLGMRERVRMFGGGMTVGRRDGPGTCVSVRMPC